MSEIIPFMGFAPDLDPSTPGIWLDCQNYVPTVKGFEPLEQLMAFYPALPGPVQGAILARYLDGTSRLIAGTGPPDNKLYVGNNGIWTDKSGALTFTLTAIDRWRFTVFGNDVIAVNGVDAPCVAAGPDATFITLAGSPPIARLVANASNFVFMANTTVGTNQWWCSGAGTDILWTPDVATQSANDQTDETEGPFLAMKPLGPDIILYKLRSMFMGRYEGPPLIWRMILLSSDTGAAGNEAVVQFGDRHFFVGWADFWVFDGNRPQPVQSNLREYFFEESLDQNYAWKIICRWDRTRNVIFIHYPSNGSMGVLDKWLCWNPVSNKWTRSDQTIEFAILPELANRPGMTYDGFSTAYTTYNGIPAGLTYGSDVFGVPFAPGQAVFGTDHVLYSFTGTPGASSLLTGDYGDDIRFNHQVRLKPRFGRYPANGSTNTLRNYYRYNLGDAQTADGVHNLHDQGWYNFRRHARWNRFLLSFSGDHEIIGIQPIIQPRGMR